MWLDLIYYYINYIKGIILERNIIYNTQIKVLKTKEELKKQIYIKK